MKALPTPGEHLATVTDLEVYRRTHDLTPGKAPDDDHAEIINGRPIKLSRLSYDGLSLMLRHCKERLETAKFEVMVVQDYMDTHYSDGDVS